MKDFAEFELYTIQTDLFYTVYDYLRFVKPEKWGFIHSTDDFSFMDDKEMKELAHDAITWLENEQFPKINIWNKEEGSPREWSTLYYMTLAFINTVSSTWDVPSLYKATSEELSFYCQSTIDWLRKNANNIK